MKKTSLMFIFLVIISLIICQGQVYKEEDIYTKINERICRIEESGIKLQYSTRKSIEQELEIINNTLLKSGQKIQVTSTENEHFNFYKSNENNSIKLALTLEEECLRVEIELVDKKGLMNIEKVKIYLEKLLDYTTTNTRYFTYIKGKINDKEDIISHEKKLVDSIGYSNIENKDTVSIENGITGTIDLKSDYKLNYSIMKYDDGTYLVVGTPIIFTTY